ncbi:PilZ domain-containing protein [Desulfogranum marinum]|uniref:PilZ domain-containing protein n=1 Tax=Desulfogranum marinum TaxID=453220 RepID=UPI0019631C5B|nr:PilZ domain-containing protein [Desulfogranum marinum]MBM9513529.1 PilZ domain-containing protein [Desulfogranum marinum]
MNNERRQAQRIHFTSTALVHFDSGQTLSAAVKTENISLKGLFIITETKIPLQTDCSVDITLEGKSSTLQFTVVGTVCRHEPEGFAMVFSTLSPDSYAHITNLMHLRDQSDK